MIVYKPEIESLLVEKLCSMGCSPQEATALVEALVMAEMCGEKSHGLRMINAHTQKIKRGGYALNTNIEVEVSTNSFARINCHNTIGMYSAKECMQYAIDHAKTEGVYTVLANHCNTYSSAFVYTYQAVQQGMVGLTFCNTPAQMPAYGGLTRLFGSNPISYAIPGDKEDPIIFDMATSIVAKSKIAQAKAKGESIPEGWALDCDGHSTTDPNVAMTGLLMPFAGGPKGIGIAMMIDLLSGLLSGAAYLDNVGFLASDNMNVGQVFVAIDPKLIYGEKFYEEVDTYIDKIHASISTSRKPVQVPGENKMRHYRRSLVDGIDIDDALYQQLLKLTEL